VIHVNQIKIETKMHRKLPIYNQNIPKQLEQLKVHHKIEFWRIYHNFINFLSELKILNKARKLSI
jgi:hypothetical protein